MSTTVVVRVFIKGVNKLLLIFRYEQYINDTNLHNKSKHLTRHIYNGRKCLINSQTLCEYHLIHHIIG